MQWLAIWASISYLSVNFLLPPPAFQKCLPKEINATEVIAVETKTSSSGDPVAKKITVKDKLVAMKARCQKGQLVDAAGREIRFYRLAGCWGNPPADYLEILESQQNAINELKKRYTVIEIPCNIAQAPQVIH